MQSIVLATTGRSTSRLGFGCSSLIGAVNKKQSLRLLNKAYDNGIRHFDVAPMYGYGEAEMILGEFAERRHDVTLATKFGLLPARGKPWVRSSRRWAARVLDHLPAVKRRLVSASDRLAGAGAKARFDVPTARLSLENSLRNLRTEHVDLWLLHEAETADLCDDSLLRFLQDAQTSGKIGAFGIGSEACKIRQLLSERIAYCPVLQFDWSVFDAPIVMPSVFRIHHRSLSTRFVALHRLLLDNYTMCKEWSSLIGVDLQKEGNLAALMLKASLEINPLSIVLFSSKSAARIEANADTAANSALGAPAQCLFGLLRSPA